MSLSFFLGRPPPYSFRGHSTTQMIAKGMVPRERRVLSGRGDRDPPLIFPCAGRDEVTTAPGSEEGSPPGCAPAIWTG